MLKHERVWGVNKVILRRCFGKIEAQFLIIAKTNNFIEINAFQNFIEINAFQTRCLWSFSSID